MGSVTSTNTLKNYKNQNLNKCINIKVKNGMSICIVYICIIIIFCLHFTNDGEQTSQIH